MIHQYQFELAPSETAIPFSCAYKVYAYLLEQLPEQVGSLLHQQGETPISVWTYRDRDNGTNVLAVSLLTEEMCDLFDTILSGIERFRLKEQTLEIKKVSRVGFDTTEELIRASAERYPSNRATMKFLSPTSFKQDGHYTLFPQEGLILHSLIQKWNVVCPEFLLDDADAINAIERGIRISDYSLRSSRYPLKGIRIPGFWGYVVLESRLPAPLQEIWSALLLFSGYAGVGIKTALGMGCISVSDIPTQK